MNVGKRVLWFCVAGMLGGIVLFTTLQMVSNSSALVMESPSENLKTDVNNQNSTIVIGAAFDLSVNTAFGWPQANSVQLLIDKTNAAGGILINGTPYTLTLVVADSACNATQAITAANSLLDAGAVVVIGHSCSGASLAAQSIYNAAGVAMISPSSTMPQLTEQGYTTTFRNIHNDRTGFDSLATYFRSNLNFSKSAIIDHGGWKIPGDVYSDTFVSLGGSIVGRYVISDTSLMTDVLNTIKAENPDTILDFASFQDPAQGGLINAVAQNVGMPDVVIGWNAESNDVLDLYEYASVGGVAVEGDYALMKMRPLEDMPGWNSFKADYESAGFANTPLDPPAFAAYAYDAAGMVVTAMEHADTADPIAIRNALAMTTNFDGVVGTYEGFDANGDVRPQWEWLEQYQNGEWMEVHAPISVTLNESGGNLGSLDGDIRIEFPADALTETAIVTYSETIVPSNPATTAFAFAGKSFVLEATAVADGAAITNFVNPVTITLRYSDENLAGLDENTLVLEFWNGSVWDSSGIVILERDPLKNRIVVTIDHMTEFALFGQHRVYLPVIIK